MPLVLKLLVGVHTLIVFANLATLFILPFKTPWYLWLPIITILGHHSFHECPLTVLENAIRRHYGLPQIDDFVDHYFE